MSPGLALQAQPSQWNWLHACLGPACFGELGCGERLCYWAEQLLRVSLCHIPACTSMVEA